MKKFRDKDYLKSEEGFIFCVIGSIHPKDRSIAYLKYIPRKDGKWEGKEKNYKRIMRQYTMSNLKKTIQFLKDYPKYIYESKVLNIEISTVPLTEIKNHFKPEEKLKQISEEKKRDSLQQKCLDLARVISDKSEVPVDFFGVTGSILLDIHQSFSDIDLVVYGKDNSQRVKKTLINLYEENNNHFGRLASEKLNKWCEKKSNQFPISPEEARIMYKRKWDRGIYKNRLFSMSSVKLDSEVEIDYGDRTYQPEGLVKIEATVSNSTESLFMPSVYQLKNIEVLKGKKPEDIRSVVSYEGFYRDIAREGEKIKVYGKLEKVFDKQKENDYHRVLVGSFEAGGKDFIKPILS
ncbi:hypothetical protein AKJ65_03480 [candidate division MSBL1 archaeon SCGC-AAA259E19]|uniref:Polymerase nucleotidyl transferase domain-containing protein n=1 Tax=candidate division MSBL1 archaeon SCGC-AAA259E19 TaxID=1698264 RepID=A0A133UKP0_9EURY|nr:hypothetical protein AKJ65_03480 [candidate division MSBL1 archaeon SCGC-AAA259E19]